MTGENRGIGMPRLEGLDHVALAMRHLAFRTDAGELAAAREALERRGIAVRFEDHDLAHSIHFTDPDGHLLEITTYDLPTVSDRDRRILPQHCARVGSCRCRRRSPS